MNFFKIILLTMGMWSIPVSSHTNVLEENKMRFLPVLIEAEADNNYTKFTYNEKLQLTNYENNLSLKTREGYFIQQVAYRIEYDKKDRIKTIFRTQHSFVDSVAGKPETVKISCSYKGNTVRLTNEMSRTETILELNQSEQLVKSVLSFNKTNNVSTYDYDAAGNLTRIKTTYDNLQNQLFESITECTFDKQVSMTKDLNVPQWFQVVYLNIFGLNNNLLQKKYTDSMKNSASFDHRFGYLYDKNGYPKEMIVTENENTQPIKISIRYSHQ